MYYQCTGLFLFQHDAHNNIKQVHPHFNEGAEVPDENSSLRSRPCPGRAVCFLARVQPGKEAVLAVGCGERRLV
jgi:hypothetical protein